MNGLNIFKASSNRTILISLENGGSHLGFVLGKPRYADGVVSQEGNPQRNLEADQEKRLLSMVIYQKTC